MKLALRCTVVVLVAVFWASGLWAQEESVPPASEQPAGTKGEAAIRIESAVPKVGPVAKPEPAAEAEPAIEDGVTVEIIIAYLERMDVAYKVESWAKVPVIVMQVWGNNVNYAVSIVIYDPIKVVYLSMDRIMTIPNQHPRKAVLLQRLMELNWEHFLAKYEWEKRNGEVRLSYSFSTENGLGYDAFAACFEHLILTADHDYPKLMRLMWAEEKEAPAPTTVVPPESRPEEAANAKETEPKPETKTKETEPKPETPASPE